MEPNIQEQNPAAQFSTENYQAPQPVPTQSSYMPQGHPPQAHPQPIKHPYQSGNSDTSLVMNKISDKISQILILFYFFIASVLLLRFVFSLFGANRSTPFAEFVYAITTPFMFLFEGMFGGGVGIDNYQLEPEIFVALIVYALIFFGIARLVRIIFK